jgi:hypothetical protein
MLSDERWTKVVSILKRLVVNSLARCGQRLGARWSACWSAVVSFAGVQWSVSLAHCGQLAGRMQMNILSQLNRLSQRN